jgi:8-oxo-dGTP pyrophosphatase MutT (NUDIX family)
MVIFHEQAGRGRHYLLLHYPTGHWDFAKGHVEKDEEDLATAIREAREETGLDKIQMVPGFRHEFEYWYRHKDIQIRKKVSWFLGRVDTDAVKISHEHQGYEWLPFTPAMERVTYGNAKDLLRRADEYLKTHDAKTWF